MLTSAKAIRRRQDGSTGIDLAHGLCPVGAAAKRSSLGF
jgi:hypothetical protein